MSKDYGLQLKLASPSMSSAFIDWLCDEPIFKKNNISSVYYPAWKDDYSNARSWMCPEISSWDSYLKLLKKTMRSDIAPEILLQGLTKVPDDTLKKYLDLGITKFTISNDATAYRLKELAPDVFISASITKALSPDEIKTNDYSMYDEICLFFYYTLHLSVIEQLPKKYEYSMCGNSGCFPICRHCVNHWMSNEMYECRYTMERRTRQNDVSFNVETYNKYFKPYISRIKMLDRLSPMESMIEDLTHFFDNNSLVKPRDYYDRDLNFPDIYNKERINMTC